MGRIPRRLAEAVAKAGWNGLDQAQPIPTMKEHADVVGCVSE